MSEFVVQTEETDDYTVLVPIGDVDAYTVDQFREAIGSVVEAEQLLVDLTEVPFMDSAGLGALINGIRRNRDHGGSIAVVCNPALNRLLHTTGFDRIVPVTESREEAVVALEAGFEFDE